MGRKTWDLARSFGQTSYPNKQNYVFSRRPRTHKDVLFVRKSVGTFARELRGSKGKNVWLDSSSMSFRCSSARAFLSCNRGNAQYH
jgi:dihydrofolate reductase